MRISPCSVWLNAPMKVCASPAPRRSGRAMRGRLPASLLTPTLISCARSQTEPPRAASTYGTRRIFLIEASLQTEPHLYFRLVLVELRRQSGKRSRIENRRVAPEISRASLPLRSTRRGWPVIDPSRRMTNVTTATLLMRESRPVVRQFCPTRSHNQLGIPAELVAEGRIVAHPDAAAAVPLRTWARKAPWPTSL